MYVKLQEDSASEDRVKKEEHPKEQSTNIKTEEDDDTPPAPIKLEGDPEDCPAETADEFIIDLDIPTVANKQ